MAKFSDLPADIMLDIFTRLPAESVLSCKSVSKTWKNLLHDQSFSQMHSNLLLSNLGSGSDSGKLISFVIKMGQKLCYLEYDDENSSHKLKELILNPRFEVYSILGSCNGLICIKGLPKHYTMDESTNASYVAYVCNPITRECITLPELDRSTYYHRVRIMLCGFGYVASTNKYKVVRLYTFRDEHGYAQIEVYTLGSGKGWRNAGKLTIDSESITRQNAVFVNGFLYWLLGNGNTVAFDLADEIFVGRYFECPNEHLWLGVLGSYLCGTHYIKDGRHSDVWLLKKKEDESFGWIKEFSLTKMSKYSYATSLALTGDGRVLCYSDTKLHLYNLKSSTFKMLEDFGKPINYAVPHTNSLVSLKAFGEENVETVEAGGSNRNLKKHRKRKNR